MDTERRIIEVATDLFRKYGIKSVTMDDIANEISISKKTIYQFFKDKNAIVTRATNFMLSEEERVIEEIIANSNDVMDELIQTIEYFKKFMRFINPVLLVDLEKFYPEGWAEYQYFKESCFKSNLINSLKRGIEEGFFRNDINVEVMAKLRMAQVELGFNQKVFPHHQYDLYDIQLQFSEHFILGLSTRKGFDRIEAYKQSLKK